MSTVFETYLNYPKDLLYGEADKLLFMLLEHLKLDLVRRSEAGCVELLLRPKED